ncbi:hypothetical protein [Actinomadura sp. CNU-125]|uniref:hypothetical protein n=1 Tax=Actinomadura sp. CNU-125 TaxID=1904961 RepID=UPI0011774DA3|nr:hypothetical protein [Actinomadura sp. CNU-125]
MGSGGGGAGAGDEPGRAARRPVVLGPEGAPDDEVARAVAALRLLLADAARGGGRGRRSRRGISVRTPRGERGDQRDAVLAALRAVGVRDARRLGDRAAVMVALFGPAATKRVGPRRRGRPRRDAGTRCIWRPPRATCSAPSSWNGCWNWTRRNR